MRKFTDAAGRTWDVVLSIGALKRVRDQLQVNLLDLEDGKLLDRLASDPILLVDVIFVVCSKQAEKAGVTDEDFGEAMIGETLDSATAALMEEIIESFRDPRRRTVMRELLRKSRQLEAAVLEKAEKMATAIDLEKLLASVSGESSTSSQELSE